MRKIKTNKLSKYLTTIILLISMILTAGIAAILSLSENGWKFGGNPTGATQPENQPVSNYYNMFGGTGHVYDMWSGNKYAMDNYAKMTGASLGSFAYGKMTDTAGLVLNYKIKAGEMISDVFRVHAWGFTFYPSPDADVIGIDMTSTTADLVGRATLIHFYGRIPGITSCRMVNYSAGGTVGTSGPERAITVNFEVLANLDSNGNNLINTGAAQKKGTLATRKFVMWADPAIVPLTSLVNNPNECEIIGVGQTENRNAIGGQYGLSVSTDNSFVTYPTSHATAALRGLRYGNKSLSIGHASIHMLSLEVAVKHIATGKIDFIPIILSSSDNRGYVRDIMQGRFDQSYTRTKSGTGAINVVPADSFYLKPIYEELPYYHTNNDGMLAPGSVASAISRIPTGGYQISIRSAPVLVRPYAQTWLVEQDLGVNGNGYSAALHYFSNNPNWSQAARPKAYANTIKGEVNGTEVTLQADSKNSANYPTIELQGKKAVRMTANDISSTATASDIKNIVGIHSYTYGVINMALAGNAVYVSGGENMPGEVGFGELPAEAVLEIRNETKNVNSYVTVYFNMSANAKGGEWVERNNLPIEGEAGNREKETTRSGEEIEYIVKNGHARSIGKDKDEEDELGYYLKKDKEEVEDRERGEELTIYD